ncbi:MAG: hypothetical protein H0T87_11895 [Gammaproteobacteria bacterium]|nr:hypothetical protein [Gammaproteobacteria bacterium]
MRFKFVKLFTNARMFQKLGRRGSQRLYRARCGPLVHRSQELIELREIGKRMEVDMDNSIYTD